MLYGVSQLNDSVPLVKSTDAIDAAAKLPQHHIPDFDGVSAQRPVSAYSLRRTQR